MKSKVFEDIVPLMFSVIVHVVFVTYLCAFKESVENKKVAIQMKTSYVCCSQNGVKGMGYVEKKEQKRVEKIATSKVGLVEKKKWENVGKEVTVRKEKGVKENKGNVFKMDKGIPKNVVDKLSDVLETVEKYAKNSEKLENINYPIVVKGIKGDVDLKDKKKEELVVFIKKVVKLPEKGVVDVELSISSNGKVSELVVTYSDSEVNKKYVEKKLTKKTFPDFGIFDEKEKFYITLLS